MVANQETTSVKPLNKDTVDRAIQSGQDYFRRSQTPEGYWWGQLQSSTMEAEYLSP